MIKVSVIVPVFNVQEHLKRCLDSIINQTIRDIEIIVINDGSTDDSEEIINEFLQIDSRIIYYKHENIGLGPTRNRGIKYAKGKYLAFIDSDDYISVNMLESLYNKAEEETADVVCGQLYLTYMDGSKVLRKDFSGVETFSFKKQDNKIFWTEYYFARVYSYNACDKLYKAEIIKKNNIVFGDNKRIFAEDNYFQLQVLEHVDIISFVNESVYFYYQRENSIMHSYKEKVGERQLTMVSDYKEMIKSDVRNSVCDLLIFEAIIMEVLNIILAKKGLHIFIKNMQKIRSHPLFKEAMIQMVVNKSYRLEPNKTRQLYIIVTCLLEKYRLGAISNLLTYSIYKLKM